MWWSAGGPQLSFKSTQGSWTDFWKEALGQFTSYFTKKSNKPLDGFCQLRIFTLKAQASRCDGHDSLIWLSKSTQATCTDCSRRRVEKFTVEFFKIQTKFWMAKITFASLLQKLQDYVVISWMASTQFQTQGKALEPIFERKRWDSLPHILPRSRMNLWMAFITFASLLP